MILIETNYPHFAAYARNLSYKARKQLAYIVKHNKDITYRWVPFNRELVEKFMAIWQRQLVRGKPIEWAFTVDHIQNLADRGKIEVFQAQYPSGIPVALHFIQKQDGFIECHPPMFEKSEENQKRYLAKFMWFNLIQYAIDHGLPPLNFGGGVDDWPEMVRRRKEFPNPQYKWIYVPEFVKNGDVKKYKIVGEGENKKLIL